MHFWIEMTSRYPSNLSFFDTIIAIVQTWLETTIAFDVAYHKFIQIVLTPSSFTSTVDVHFHRQLAAPYAALGLDTNIKVSPTSRDSAEWRGSAGSGPGGQRDLVGSPSGRSWFLHSKMSRRLVGM